jgi:hypothetical protein
VLECGEAGMAAGRPERASLAPAQP